ncbi:PspC domain-containing protein [Aureivirga sp. CE67]|uniref:PspC domain-containing protein n=1 Tax=Aureivirga sp. CE67 TaxID=1788983 RepID=UPI0018C9C315|nr:PspC domain-containing protein [Aureivirga sp. CE67]
MNKTVNINLGGVFFHIDEDAYEMLKNYLDSIRFSLRNDPEGLEEILNDIEARICELLSEKVKDSRQVVKTTDIEEVISIMGQPEDYSMEEDTTNFSSDTTEEESRGSKKRKYKKKFFRDGEDKFIGGVSAGFAHYIGVEPIWIRIILIVLTFVSFGSTVLVYLLLWILLPEAKTTSEKLQMRGEDINISNIQKTVSENVDKISKNVEDFGKKIKKKDFSGYENKIRNNSQRFFGTIGNVMKGILIGLRKFIGIVLLIGAIFMIANLVIALFSVNTLNHFGIFQEAFVYNSPFFFENTYPLWIISTMIFILALIPCIFWLLLSLRIISSNFKGFNLPTVLSLVGLWFISLLFVIYSGIEFSRYSSTDGITKDENELILQKKDTIIIKAIGNKKIGPYSKFNRRNKNQIFIDEGVEKKYSNNLYINVGKSNDNESLIIVKKKSEGVNLSQAQANSEEINYNYKFDNNTLFLDGYFLSPYKYKSISEYVSLNIIIPEGSIVYFDKSVKNLLYKVDNLQDIYDQNMVNHYFIMTKEGLECLDCPEDDYRNDDYIKTKKDTISIKVDIE